MSIGCTGHYITLQHTHAVDASNRCVSQCRNNETHAVSHLSEAQQFLVGDLQVFPAQLRLPQLTVDGCQPFVQHQHLLLTNTHTHHYHSVFISNHTLLILLMTFLGGKRNRVYFRSSGGDLQQHHVGKITIFTAYTSQQITRLCIKMYAQACERQRSFRTRFIIQQHAWHLITMILMCLLSNSLNAVTIRLFYAVVPFLGEEPLFSVQMLLLNINCIQLYPSTNVRTQDLLPER